MSGSSQTIEMIEVMRKRIEVMEAFAAGKPCEWRLLGDNDGWERVSNPSWDWMHCEYRIKPNPEDYLKLHNASGLKVGDRVRVTRKAESHELGWKSGWGSFMDGVIGKSGVITRDGGADGFSVRFPGEGSGDFRRYHYHYPSFVLEKVKALECWVNVYHPWDMTAHPSEEEAIDSSSPSCVRKAVRMREVIDE